MQVYNKSTEEYEEANEAICPRCTGHGRLFGDDEECFLCDGEGHVVKSESGWVRSNGGEPESAQLW